MTRGESRLGVESARPALLTPTGPPRSGRRRHGAPVFSQGRIQAHSSGSTASAVGSNANDTPAAWPAVTAVLALVALAIGSHHQLRQRGVRIPAPQESQPCPIGEGLACSDRQAGERKVGEAP